MFGEDRVRVVELFEARKPRAPAVIAEINGTIRYGEVNNSGSLQLIEERVAEPLPSGPVSHIRDERLLQEFSDALKVGVDAGNSRLH